MPSQLPVPTVQELRDAARAGVQGRCDPNADMRAGSLYDRMAGIGAMAFHRIATWDRDIIRAIYFDWAQDADLDAIVQRRRLGPARIPDAPGTGTLYLARDAATGGPGTIYAGTRLVVIPAGGDELLTYTVRADTAVGADDALLATVPIQSVATGPGTTIDTATAAHYGCRFEDAVYDPAWRVTRIVCDPGTTRQEDHELRAQVRQRLADGRVGYAKTITDACVRAGATHVAMFASDFLATNPRDGTETIGSLDAQGYGDVGRNLVFVGDATYVGTDAIVVASRLALDSVTVGGTDVQVLPMTPSLVTLTVSIALWDTPTNFSVPSIRAGAVNGILHYFDSRQNPFHFRIEAIRGAIINAVRDVQSVEIVTAPTAPTLSSIFNTVPLPRFYAIPESITIMVTGPR